MENAGVSKREMFVGEKNASTKSTKALIQMERTSLFRNTGPCVISVFSETSVNFIQILFRHLSRGLLIPATH